MLCSKIKQKKVFKNVVKIPSLSDVVCYHIVVMTNDIEEKQSSHDHPARYVGL